VNGYVAAGYGVTLLTLGGYALHVLRRGRALRRRTGVGGGGS
jgi:heme exporter protein CcmD